VLAERAYRAQEAQGASIRQPGDSGPGPRLGDIVTERLAEFGVPAEEAQWDSRKRGDNNWQVQLMFTIGGRPLMAEWVFDPRRRHVTPADDDAARLSLPEADLAALTPAPRAPVRATVTPIGSRLAAAPPPVPAPAPAERRPDPQPAVSQARSAEAHQARSAEAQAAQAAEARSPRVAEAHSPRAAEARPAHAAEGRPAAEAAETAPEAESEEPAVPQRGRARKAAGGRSRRSSVPSWDEIMFGTSRQPE
jgi:hypothetical protein